MGRRKPHRAASRERRTPRAPRHGGNARSTPAPRVCTSAPPGPVSRHAADKDLLVARRPCDGVTPPLTTPSSPPSSSPPLLLHHLHSSAAAAARRSAVPALEERASRREVGNGGRWVGVRQVGSVVVGREERWEVRAWSAGRRWLRRRGRGRGRGRWWWGRQRRWRRRRRCGGGSWTAASARCRSGSWPPPSSSPCSSPWPSSSTSSAPRPTAATLGWGRRPRTSRRREGSSLASAYSSTAAAPARPPSLAARISRRPGSSTAARPPRYGRTGALLPHALPPFPSIALMIPSSRPFRSFRFSHRIVLPFHALCLLI